MRPNSCCLFLILALLPAPGLATDDDLPRIEFLQTYPEAGTTLHAGEPLFVHFRYQSEEPLRFQLQAYFKDDQVKHSGSFNPAPAYPAALYGEAMAWVAYADQADIDQLQLIVYDAKWRKLDKAPLELHMHWSGRPTKIWQQPPEWVRILSAEQQAMAASSPEQPPAGSEMPKLPVIIFFMVLGILALVYLIIMRWVKRTAK
jgi:hypothetical protein